MLLFLLFSLSAHADNWMRISDVSAGLVRGFELERECKRDGHACQRVDGLTLDALMVSSGVIVEDPVKLKEKSDKKAAEDAKVAARRDALDKAKTIADLKAYLQSREEEE